MSQDSWLDAHCHLWALARGDYDWLDVNKPELAPIARDFSYADLTAAHKHTRIKNSIVVQAAASNAETDYLLSLAEKHTFMSGVVGWVDLSSDHVAQRLLTLSLNPFCFGIRPMLQDIKDSDWIIKPKQQNGLAALTRSTLRFDALVTSRHLSALLSMCHSHPELPVIINHAAKPVLSNNRSKHYNDWCIGMKALAEQTQAYCKVSGLLTEMSPAQRQNNATALAVLTPLFEKLLEWFGPERLVWGSDWPVVTLAADCDRWFDISQTLLTPLSTIEQNAIVKQNAMTFYDLQEVSA